MGEVRLRRKEFPEKDGDVLRSEKPEHKFPEEIHSGRPKNGGSHHGDEQGQK